MLLAAAGLTLLAPAGAARGQWGVNAGVSIGGTNNASNEVEPAAGTAAPAVPVDPLAPTSVREADGFTRFSLGGNYLIRGARLNQEFKYLFGAFVYMQSGQSLSFSNDLAYQGTFTVSPDTELALSLTGQQGRTNDQGFLNRLGGSAARPVGAENYLSAGGGQRFSWALGPDWSIGQDANAQIFEPVGDVSRQPQTWGGSAGLSLNRLWTQDTATLFARVGHGRSGTVYTADDLILFPARRANYGEAGAAWSHSYNDEWNHYLGAGVLRVQVPQIRQPFTDVSVHTALTYLTPTGGDVSLSVDRGVHTNVFVGDVLLRNAVELRGTHPFGPQEAFTLVGGIAYEQSKSVFVIDTQESGLKALTVSSQVGYDWTRHRRLLFDVNYTYQDSGAARRNMMFIAPYTLHRLNVMATLEFVFPEPEDSERIRRRARTQRGRGGGTNKRGGGDDAPGGAGVPMGIPMRGEQATQLTRTRGDGPMP